MSTLVGAVSVGGVRCGRKEQVMFLGLEVAQLWGVLSVLFAGVVA